jgi:hypothetical protein
MPTGCNDGCRVGRVRANMTGRTQPICKSYCRESCCPCSPGVCTTSRKIVECLNNRSFALLNLRLNESLLEMKTLRLQGTSVPSLEARQFALYPLLSYISLQDTNLKEVHPEAFVGLKWIRNLDLSHNPDISHLPNSVFESMHRLEYLNLPLHLAQNRCAFGINPLNSTIYSDSGERTVQVFADGVAGAP